MHAVPDAPTRSAVSRWLWAILLVAAVLRLYPIWFGLPYPMARPDEEVAVGRAVLILEGDPNPHFFHWPSLTFYVFAALFAAGSWLRQAFATDSGLTGAEQLLAARGLIALAGTACVFVLYRLGRRVAGEAVGLLAAAFLAVAVLHVRDSHFAMTDILMTTLLTLSLACLVKAYDETAAGRGTWRGFAAAGFIGGLAASTKYSAAAAGVAAVVAAALLVRTARARTAVIAGAAFSAFFATGFIAGTPYAVLDFPAFYTDLKFDFTHLSEGHEGIDLGPGWLYHATHSLPYGLGIPLFMAALAGIIPMARHYTPHALILGAFAAFFYAAFGTGSTVFFRYILPLVPMLCLAGGVGVWHLAAGLAGRSRISRAAAVTLLVVMIAGPSLATSARLDVRLARTDTRVLASEWLEAQVSPSETVHDAGAKYTQLRGQFTARAAAPPDADWLVLHDSPLPAYAAIPPELQALARERFDLVHTVRPDTGAAGNPVYDLQDAFFLPIAGLGSIERPGPTIRIYRARSGP